MFNRHDEHNHHNNQTVTVNTASGNQAVASATVALVTVGLITATVCVVALLVSQVAISLLAAITTMVTALFAAIVVALPWLAGGGVIVALGTVALRSLPQAAAEVEGIRYRRALAQSNVRMLEAKSVDDFILDVRPVPVVITIER